MVKTAGEKRFSWIEDLLIWNTESLSRDIILKRKVSELIVFCADNNKKLICFSFVFFKIATCLLSETTAVHKCSLRSWSHQSLTKMDFNWISVFLCLNFKSIEHKWRVQAWNWKFVMTGKGLQAATVLLLLLPTFVNSFVLPNQHMQLEVNIPPHQIYQI